MNGERTVVRAAIKAAIEGFYDGTVETNLYVDATSLDNYVHVYMPSGVIRTEGMNQDIAADLRVGVYSKQRDDDDALDLIADEIFRTITAPRAFAFGDVSPVGFEYANEQDSEFSGIELQFSVRFNVNPD